MRAEATSRTALIFPGVGVRLCGAEPAFFGVHRDIMRPFLREASVYCETDLIADLFDGTIDALPDALKQFFTYAYSVGAAQVARSLTEPSAVAGYSFGLYAALVAAEVLSFSDGLRLLDRANRTMQAAAAGKGYGMGITVGLDTTEIEAMLDTGAFGSLLRTNTNHAHCHVFSGTDTEVTAFLDAARNRGAFKAERLEVEIPYHHPTLLEGVTEAFAAGFDEMKWRPARIPVVSSLTGELLKEMPALRAFTARHPATPIHWEQVLATLDRLGGRVLYECGPGISLTQNGRFVSFDAAYINVRKAERWCPA